MDSAVESDGVFIGRFVLVEYDDNSYSYRRGYLGTKEVPTDTEAQYRIFADTTLKAPYVLTESDPESGYGLLPGDIVSVTFSNEVCYFKAEDLSFIDGEAKRGNEDKYIDFSKTKRILVFDLGGGTCDTSVIDVQVDRGEFHFTEVGIGRYQELGGRVTGT
jgi:hypothetical protein